ncbi:MAG TPA: HEAT repeat domain-containing protein [Planctomycetota bacterium]|nr:HEAT repeat domain-containing protein [Planctomycetota bacterium]
MKLCAATKCPPRHGALGGAGAVLVLLAGCSSAPERYRPGDLSPAQQDQCRAVERAYRTQAAEYEALRDAAKADPVVAGWLTRMFIRDVFTVREGRPLGEDAILRRAAKIKDPVETRAMAELAALGAAAVPTIVGDLLRHGQPQPRELGVELIALVGPAAIPALQELAHDAEARHRRAAARALGAIGGEGPELATLRELAGDGEYTVRADALRSLGGGGPEARKLLVERLHDDPDPFVRRVAAQTLAQYPGAISGRALVDYLERCKRERDVQGERAAQDSLQKLAAAIGPRTPAAWRAWLEQLDASDRKR